MESAAAIRSSSQSATRAKSSSLATSDGRMKTLTHLARQLERRIAHMHDTGASFNSEAKELRETIKQLAAESEGRGSVNDDSALDRIREILSDSQFAIHNSQLDLFPEEGLGQ